MLSEKHDCELELAKGMKKIFESNFAVSTMQSLQQGIIAFKNDLYNQFNYTIEFCNSLREEVIEPCKQFLNEQSNLGKKFNTEMKKCEKEFKDSIERLEKFRIKFHNSARTAEENKLQTELAKLNNTIPPDQKNKLEIRAQSALKEAKEAERVYISQVNFTNSLRENYIETMKRMLNEFQSMEEKLIELIKDSLRKYVIYQVALIRNLQYDIEKKANVSIIQIN